MYKIRPIHGYGYRKNSRNLKKIRNMKTKEQILDTVCKVYEVDTLDVFSKKKRTNEVISDARQVSMYLMREEGYSSVDIGKFMNRDHATVLYARDMVISRMGIYSKYAKKVNMCKEVLFGEDKRGGVYVSGKISGLADLNKPKFYKAKGLLKNLGYMEVVVPHDLDHSANVGGVWEEYMRVCFKGLMDCRKIAVLDDWEDSQGAKWEVDTARRLGMPMLVLDKDVTKIIREIK